MGQSLSLSATYEIILTPSLFTFDHKTENDTPVDITDDHIDKISTYVSSSAFKADINTITDVSLQSGGKDGSEITHLVFDHTSIKYNSQDCNVVVTGKWKHASKQTKKSLKKAKLAKGKGGGMASTSDTDGGGQTNAGSDDENGPDISISDIIDKIKYNLSHEAYLEHEISKQLHTYICFSESVDINKI
jgi:hypothetical protein